MSKPQSMDPEKAHLAFRACLGQFATGVTVVTCSAADGHPCGITANSFSSVSLDPPLVLWNVAKSSNSLQAFLDARHFAIHVLGDQQEELAVHFAKSDHTMFIGIEHAFSDQSVPILPEWIALLECSTDRIHDSGDHFIIVGHVDRFSWNKADPLLFFNGRYRRLSHADD